MQSILIYILAFIAGLGLFGVHVHGFWRQRRALWLAVFFDLVVGGLALLALLDHSTFVAWLQEDAWIEWATFYAFAAAAVTTWLWLRKRWRPLLKEDPMALMAVLGVSLFCVFVAAEEISWGQRLFALTPPELFLEENYQQELNVHNFLNGKALAGFALDTRYLVALVAVIYGLVLVALAHAIKGGRLASALAAAAPPATLVPWFAIVAWVELTYPVEYTGEAAEFVLGLLFFAAALARPPAQVEKGRKAPRGARTFAVLSACVVLGLATPPLVQRLWYGSDEALVAQTRAELEALRHDILQDGVIALQLHVKKRTHKRLFRAVRQGYLDPPAAGRFLEAGSSSVQSKQVLPARRNRRGYFLDPWNNPYWIYHLRRDGRIVLYSFGPNRRRDTAFRPQGQPSDAPVQGDDIGIAFPLPSLKARLKIVSRLPVAKDDPSAPRRAKPVSTGLEDQGQPQ